MVSLGERLTHGVMIIPGLEYQEDFSNYGGRTSFLLTSASMSLKRILWEWAPWFSDLGLYLEEQWSKTVRRSLVETMWLATLWILSPPARGYGILLYGYWVLQPGATCLTVALGCSSCPLTLVCSVLGTGGFWVGLGGVHSIELVSKASLSGVYHSTCSVLHNTQVFAIW